MKTLVTALLFLCSICAFAAGNGVKVPPYERVQLGNGAVVLLMERHDVPLIAFSAVLRGGAVSDPAGGSGVASLLAGLLQKGAGARDAVQFAETVASVGGQIETSVSTESISVNGSFLARDQQLMVELVADLLQRPRLEQAQFDTLRARQIEFIRAAKESDLGALAPIYGESELFAGHPYGRSVDGSESVWGTVTAWEPPRRFVFAWLITPEWKCQSDLAQASEVEVTFTPIAGGGTRVDLEHRHFERHGAGADAMRRGVDAEGGWGSLMQMFAAKVDE